MAVTIPLDNLIFDSTENIFTPTCKNNDQQVISIKSQVNFILKSNNFRWSLEVLFSLQMMIVKVKHLRTYEWTKVTTNNSSHVNKINLMNY